MVPAFLYNLAARRMSPLGQFGFSVGGEYVCLTSLKLFDLFGFVWPPMTSSPYPRELILVIVILHYSHQHHHIHYYAVSLWFNPAANYHWCTSHPWALATHGLTGFIYTTSVHKNYTKQVMPHTLSHGFPY